MSQDKRSCAMVASRALQHQDEYRRLYSCEPSLFIDYRQLCDKAYLADYSENMKYSNYD